MLIPVDAQNLASAAQNAPTIRTQAKPNAKHPKELVTVLTWQPQLKDFDGQSLPMPLPVKVLFNAGGTSALKLQVTIQNDLSGQPPTSEATGELTNFTLQLFEVIDITIASIKFTSKNGAKSLVTLDLAGQNPIGFDGPLQFVQTLANILPPGLFGGGGPSIQATKTELKVSYTLGLPPLTCGVFSLEHIAIMAGLDLPYVDGKPAVEFAFASRSKPFLLTVEIFGGGGFVHLIVGADGVQMVEGSLEFGGNFAFDIRVASGGVHAMAGDLLPAEGDQLGPDRVHRHRRRGVGPGHHLHLPRPQSQPELAALRSGQRDRGPRHHDGVRARAVLQRVGRAVGRAQLQRRRSRPRRGPARDGHAEWSRYARGVRMTRGRGADADGS